VAKRAKTGPSRSLAVEAARAAEQNNCTDIVVLDLRGVSPVTDYFVIATGTSNRQMRSVHDDIIARGQSAGQRVWQVAGLEAADWIVLDFVDVVVHLFDAEHRRYYDLEMMWGDAPRVRWRKPVRRKATK
jgi:ribosome-associated protein